MGLAPDIVQRFFRAARKKAETAEALGEKMEPFLGRRPTKTAINHWVGGVDRPTAEAMIAAALAMRIRIDDYLERTDLDETPEESIARLTDDVAALQHEMRELREVVGDLVGREREEEGRSDRDQTGQVG